MGRLDDKVAIITGGAGGMGVTHAKAFVREGAKVVIADLESSNGQKVADDLGDNTVFVPLDVVREDSWKNVIKKTEETFGPVDILINNAGISRPNSIENMSLEEYRQIISINQDSVFLGMKYVLPSMKKTKNGSIVNISSINGFVGSENNSAYITSKFAIRGMTKAAAAEFAKYGIRVNSVHPGTIRTAMTEQESIKPLVQEMEKNIPLKRIAEPEEITNLVLYVASDESSYSTGTEFLADGGLLQVI